MYACICYERENDNFIFMLGSEIHPLIAVYWIGVTKISHTGYGGFGDFQEYNHVYHICTKCWLFSEWNTLKLGNIYH